MPRTDPASEPGAAVLDRPARRVPAPAKINLALHVVGRRADGYHELESLAVFTRLGDELAVADAADDSLDVSGPFAAGVPTDSTNLVLRARDLVRQTGPARCGPVAVSLVKNLPVASGIGGGSSDAAAAIGALVRHWRLDIADDARSAIAATLGADVPMCLAAKPLIARGVGERIEPVGRFPALQMVLVNPGVPVATASVFRALRSAHNAPLPTLPGTIDFDALVAWLAGTRNDLEAPALSVAPIIGKALDALGSQGAAFTRMSGSGATCFGLFRDAGRAAAAAAAIRQRHPGWFVAATTSGGAED